MILALDTETTGVDLRHGVAPFLVTFCNEAWENTWFEWDVNPLNRKVLADKADLEEIISLIEAADELVLQNAKFDVTALGNILPKTFKWPWKKTFDTLISGHLLASNHPHDLESMAVQYLSIDPKRYEDRMRVLVTKCRSLVNKKGSPIGHWRIARAGLPEMPSAKEKVWKYDLWLPRAIAKYVEALPERGTGDMEDLIQQAYFGEVYPLLEELKTVTATYANSDSATTLGVSQAHKEYIEARELGKIAANRMQVVPVIELMQRNGVTANGDRRDELEIQYIAETHRAATICQNIAAGYGYELTLPKGGNNGSLTKFCFEEGLLELPIVRKSKKTGVPSLDKKVIEVYQVILDARSKQLTFVNNLAAKRKRDTALSYMSSYKRFWRALAAGGYFRLFPSINPTGTDTLRMSSNNPNEQNISKQEGFNLRYIFGPAPGREWWSLDAKNIELRIPAYESGEAELIDLFERPDDAPYYGSTHLLNFHTVYPDLWDEQLGKLIKSLGSKEEAWTKVGPACKKFYAASWYQYCKNGGFAVQYGAIEREGGTADQAFHREGSHALLRERFGQLDNLNQYWIDYANENGYVQTMPDKFVDPERGYPLLCTRDFRGGILPTVPLNYHVQGTAMWWMCQAMIRTEGQLDAWRDSEGFSGFITMQVHDELVFDFPAGRGSRPWLTNLPRIERLAELMAKGGEGIGVPTPVGIEYHSKVWSEGVTLK